MMNADSAWWWIRHAPVEAAAQGRINGHRDVAADLSDRIAIERLASVLPADATWITSGLRRTVDTAAALLMARGEAIEPEVNRAFLEQDFGDWDGIVWDDIDPLVSEAFWKDPVANRPPNGESFAEMVRRIADASVEVARQSTNKDVIVVGHAGSIRAALSLSEETSLSDALEYEIAPLSLSCMRFSGAANMWLISNVNRTFNTT